MRVLQLAIATPARYIAMIGSKRKVLNVIRNSRSRNRAQRVRAHHAPWVGYRSHSPEEIAISVTAR